MADAAGLDALRALAEAARASEWYCPNWYAEEDPEAGGYWSVNARGDGVSTPIHGHMAYGADEATYRYLAALEPNVILDLLNRADIRGCHICHRPLTGDDWRTFDDNGRIFAVCGVCQDKGDEG